MRFNHLNPPFDNPAIRRAMLGAVNQSDYMIGMVGTDDPLWRDQVGFFCPGTPMASDAGMEALTGPRDLAKVKRELEAAGYKGEKIVLLAPTDIPSAKALADITADMLQKLGMNVDYAGDGLGHAGAAPRQEGPGGSGRLEHLPHLLERRSTSSTRPATSSCAATARTPPSAGRRSPTIEELRDAWFEAPDLAGAEEAGGASCSSRRSRTCRTSRSASISCRPPISPT